MGQPVEEITSANRKYKVEIWRRSDGNLQVFLLRWLVEDALGYGKVAEFWAEVRMAATIVDSLERARAIGHELLRSHASRGEAEGDE